ncbi:hypothetical protein ANO11243_003650 [Dothideomycetidae sp. 11243]|nr:hypothetical protein ANO11243_003650 [fungal sp. No.11243]
MTSSKGEPDNPGLREKIKEEVKNLDKGGGKGSWSAWKAGELSRRYEAAGGGYKNVAGSKNKPQKGEPEKKSDAQKNDEEKTAPKAEEKKPAASSEDKKEATNGEKKDTPAPKKDADKKKDAAAGGEKKSAAAEKNGKKRKEPPARDDISVSSRTRSRGK